MGPELLLYGGLLAIGIALGTIVLSLVVGSDQPTGVAKSLALIEQTVQAKEVAKQDLPFMERLVIPVFDHTKALAVRLSPGGSQERLARMLDRAGNPGSWTPERVMGAKGCGMILGVLLGLTLGGLTVRGAFYAVLLGAGLFFLPDLLVYNSGLRRQQDLRKGMSDALDMLTVCVEAGQGFDGALLQVARSVKGPIAGEFARVLSEIQIGKSRGEAFGSLGERTTAPEVKNFVSALIQADRLGLPIANVLREQSKEMRIVRRQQAEEKAQKVPVKIIFPMLLCIFPAMFIVIIGPGAIRMIETFSRL
jgi:tight adherence protein C